MRRSALTPGHFFNLVFSLTVLVGFAVPASGQGGASPSSPAAQRSGSAGGWEIDVHGGFMSGARGGGGTGITEFPVGASLPGALGAPASRSVSSWFFGDGALLLNTTNTAFGLTSKGSPLDSTLQSSVARRRRGANFGARVGRPISPRLSVEFGFDYSSGAIGFTKGATEAIDQATAGFVSAWKALLSTGGTTNVLVTSSSDIDKPAGRQILAIGAVNVSLKPGRTFRPFVTAGGGILLNQGEAPRATLTGNYEFRFVGAPMSETDTISVRSDAASHAFVGVLGAGAKLGRSALRGLRLDFRMYLMANSNDTLVDATPLVATATPIFAISTGRGIQFSNNPTTGFQSSLSGPAVTDLNTFSGGGLQTQTSLTLGYFFRF